MRAYSKVASDIFGLEIAPTLSVSTGDLMTDKEGNVGMMLKNEYGITFVSTGINTGDDVYKAVVQKFPGYAEMYANGEMTAEELQQKILEADRYESPTDKEYKSSLAKQARATANVYGTKGIADTSKMSKADERAYATYGTLVNTYAKELAKLDPAKRGFEDRKKYIEGRIRGITSKMKAIEDKYGVLGSGDTEFDFEEPGTESESDTDKKEYEVIDEE
jgi:hypothetical protein